MFLKRYDLLVKFLINYQTVYLQQTCIRLLILVENHYQQYHNVLLDNTTSVISRCGSLSPFLSFVILFSVLPSNFIVLGVKS